MQLPNPTLVLTSNSPDKIHLLEEFFQQQNGHKPQFHESGWTSTKTFPNDTTYNKGNPYDYGDGKGNGFGNDKGDGSIN